MICFYPRAFYLHLVTGYVNILIAGSKIKTSQI